MTAYKDEGVAYQRTVCPDAEATDGMRLTYTDATAHNSMFGAQWHRHGLSRAGRPLRKLVNTAGTWRIV
ncbi:hypothetical protein FAF44_10905 [Nonomuraea sp. MG754425]|uniref:hypothetical protein n=1 Tax=Nonomuraea sp. MG754425 TaxID=2570319 RepID=UPI001F2D538B|nr:hypothetical protein [Nonomuraea sp. MG754425]MCF6468894.1 hypothetical protein [Nonomuraea sp. MG754425]